MTCATRHSQWSFEPQVNTLSQSSSKLQFSPYVFFAAAKHRYILLQVLASGVTDNMDHSPPLPTKTTHIDTKLSIKSAAFSYLGTVGGVENRFSAFESVLHEQKPQWTTGNSNPKWGRIGSVARAFSSGAAVPQWTEIYQWGHRDPVGIAIPSEAAVVHMIRGSMGFIVIPVGILTTRVGVRNRMSPMASLPMSRSGIPNKICDVDAMELCIVVAGKEEVQKNLASLAMDKKILSQVKFDVDWFKPCLRSGAHVQIMSAQRAAAPQMGSTKACFICISAHVAAAPLRYRASTERPLRPGRCDVVVRLLDSQQGKPGLIPGGATPGFPHVGIVSYDAVGQRVFSGISRFPRSFIPALLHTYLASPPRALKTSMAFKSAHLTVNNLYLQCDKNTARQITALRLAAKAHFMRDEVSPLSLPRLKRGKPVQVGRSVCSHYTKYVIARGANTTSAAGCAVQWRVYDRVKTTRRRALIQQRSGFERDLI
ncbi:hypothetical protein PR048_018130 [Dryococelus australis]|uniref:Uncharacterized protein n=1 Tax=Dryococelus australis TaxID=614101 RepID=A0ABQ9HBI9_9NEOP|nr:hypothetical protein PR048_018130 [Dryococelus australis]